MLNKNCENVNPQNVITRGKSLTLTVPEVGGDSSLLRLVMRSTSSSSLVLYMDVDTLESNTVETGLLAHALLGSIAELYILRLYLRMRL